MLLCSLPSGSQPAELFRHRVPDDCPAGVADLVAACLSDKGSARPSAAEIVALLSGDPAALEKGRPKAYSGTDAPDAEVTRLSRAGAAACT